MKVRQHKLADLFSCTWVNGARIASSLKRCFPRIAGMMFRIDMPPAARGRHIAVDCGSCGAAGFGGRISKLIS